MHPPVDPPAQQRPDLATSGAPVPSGFDLPLPLPGRLPREVPAAGEPDEVFDRYARLIRTALGVPVGLVSLVTRQGQTLPGAVGLPPFWQRARCTGLSHSFCQHVVARDAPLVVRDARRDPVLADNRAIDDLGVIAYAGFPLHDPDGLAVGALCAIDTAPREWTQTELDVLADLAATASRELTLRRAHRQVATAQQAEQAALEHAAQVSEQMAIGYLQMDPEWRITYVNAQGRRVLGAAGDDLTGQVLWELFPATVGTLYETNYRRAVDTGEVVAFDAYYPAPLDAWFEIRATPTPAHRGGGLALYFLDVTARHEAEAAAVRSAARLAALGQVALALADAQTIPDLVAVMVEQGLSALGADGGSMAVPDPDDDQQLLSYITADFGEDTRADFGRLPLDAALPVAAAARTGTRVLLSDAAACAAFSQHTVEANAATGCQAWASIPLRAGGQVLGVLTAGWSGPQTFPAEQVSVLESFAAQCAQALQRLRAHEAERVALAAAAGISETLQRSMLTAPPEPDHLQITVRYAASAAHAEVGGDWYDAFITSAGMTTLVIGDVTGHDMSAAAVMGQVRNLLRGIGFTLGDPPARLLSAVDRASAGLGLEAVATALVAQIEQDGAHRAAGTRLLRWSNAGHLPPLLIEADGSTRYLDTGADLLLGFDPEAERHDHEQLLAPGSAVLLFTDGLVERRGAHLSDGLDWLAATAASLTRAGADLEQLCDGLLAAVAGHLEDDVALLALRAHPEDAPRPPGAGPAHVPAGLPPAEDASPDL
ncbi:hypothetical protein GCM10027586_19240 [Kineococcus gypseus]|uniref:SpoIIE family protein phosphatase n=1 Tax=Kineococcus gypseus TaxID=1637102 RepID=UPI003D7E9CA9